MKNSKGPDFDALKAEHRRLAILRTLLGDSTATASMTLLRDWLPRLGLRASTDVVRADLRMLASIGLIALNDEHDAWGVELTQRGAEVAEGVVVADGVLKPPLDCPY